ncbi:hypothetical protein BV22DRAFT_1132665 [Leucogyrophana mollusca]|uniref:Uncharacterized protein n=1 Tax=Leucogyrophana mollusca TaxID=85980 RepID=A0ACB8B5Y9_9AGAM|nr:hypothetical protein BV22DRAFT_1132665 [Leucogyrophana mollusca]
MPITLKISMLTTALSASLQAFYTIYTALLVYLTQRVSLSGRLSRRQMLTTIHDMTGAWGGLGAALDGLWQQTKVVASPLEVLSITAYLLNISVLHIASSSIIQFQTFNNTVMVSAPTAVGWPDSSVDYNGFDWATISSLAPSVGNLSSLGNAGLANGTVYDVLLDGTGIGNVTVNATSIDADCALAAGMVYDSTEHPPQFFDQNGSAFPLTFIPWKDQVIFNINGMIAENALNFYVTTAIEGSAALLNRTTIPMNWTYYAPPNISIATIDMSWIFCNISLIRTSAIVDAESNTFLSSISEPPASSIWIKASLPAFSPQEAANETWFWAPFSSAPLVGVNPICSASEASEASEDYDSYDVAQPSGCGYQSSTLDAYLMQLLGMNASQIDPLLVGDPQLSSNTTPSFTLSVDQMETALSQVLAATIWTAGQLGTVGGGFDHSVGSATITRLVLETRLNINWIPLLFALSASIILLVLEMRMTRANSENPPKSSAVNSGGVLELIWLASRLPSMRDAIGRVDNPNIDDLRAAGRFDVLLADVGTEDLAAKHNDDCEPQGGSRGVVTPLYTSIPIEDPTPLRETIMDRLLDGGELTLDSVEVNIERLRSEFKNSIALKNCGPHSIQVAIDEVGMSALRLAMV